jgi:hypothetical protein
MLVSTIINSQKTLLFIICTVLLFSCNKDIDEAVTEIPHTQSNPNILLIITYDMGLDASEALYNLSIDPLETTNLLDSDQLPLSSSDNLIKEDLVAKLYQLNFKMSHK